MCREGPWKGRAAAGTNRRGPSGQFARNASRFLPPVAVVPAAQNTVCDPALLASLREQACAALERDGQLGALIAGEADVRPSLGTGLVLHQHNGAHKATPGRAARAFWKEFVKQGCLERLTKQVHQFLLARKSPPALLPATPWRVNLLRYAAEGGGTAAFAQQQGMTDHYDMTTHCAVTLCLTGDGDEPGLHWTCHGERRPLRLDAGDIAILASGVLHGVARVARKEARVVVILFF